MDYRRVEAMSKLGSSALEAEKGALEGQLNRRNTTTDQQRGLRTAIRIHKMALKAAKVREGNGEQKSTLGHMERQGREADERTKGAPGRMSPQAKADMLDSLGYRPAAVGGSMLFYQKTDRHEPVLVDTEAEKRYQAKVRESQTASRDHAMAALIKNPRFEDDDFVVECEWDGKVGQYVLYIEEKVSGERKSFLLSDDHIHAQSLYDKIIAVADFYANICDFGVLGSLPEGPEKPFTAKETVNGFIIECGYIEEEDYGYLIFLSENRTSSMLDTERISLLGCSTEDAEAAFRLVNQLALEHTDLGRLAIAFRRKLARAEFAKGREKESPKNSPASGPETDPFLGQDVIYDVRIECTYSAQSGMYQLSISNYAFRGDNKTFAFSGDRIRAEQYFYQARGYVYGPETKWEDVAEDFGGFLGIEAAIKKASSKAEADAGEKPAEAGFTGSIPMEHVTLECRPSTVKEQAEDGLSGRWHIFSVANEESRLFMAVQCDAYNAEDILNQWSWLSATIASPSQVRIDLSNLVRARGIHFDFIRMSHG